MRDTADPRVDPAYDAWDRHPYFGPPAVDKNAKPLPKKKTNERRRPPVNRENQPQPTESARVGSTGKTAKTDSKEQKPCPHKT